MGDVRPQSASPRHSLRGPLARVTAAGQVEENDKTRENLPAVRTMVTGPGLVVIKTTTETCDLKNRKIKIRSYLKNYESDLKFSAVS